MPESESRTDMKKLIFCDIDGCLNEGKNVPLDVAVLSEISALIPGLSQRGIGFTLCTGRPQPYAEAVAQLLGCNLPFVCEGGAMVYAPERDEYRSMADPASLKDVEALRAAIGRSDLLNSELFFEIGKAYSLCVTGPYLAGRGHDGIRAVMDDLKQRYAGYPANWSHSTASIDITPDGISKASGVRAVSAEFGVDLADTIGIGDSNGDLSMLSVVGQAFCPGNASAEVKQVSHYVSELEYVHGTLDILKRIASQD